MKAWRVHEFAPYHDALVREECDDPTPVPQSTVIDVEAAGVNFPDVLFIEGGYQIRPPLPFVPGVEAAGRVIATGPDSRFQVGDRLVTAGIGAFADRMLVMDSMAFKLPDGISSVDAAAMRIVYETSYGAIAYRAQLRPGEVLLVHGGAGGVGTASIQVGKAIGATVIATASGERNIQVCLDCGADHVIDWKNEDIVTEVKRLTGGRGADVIMDPVGGDAFDASTHCINFEGRLIVIGFASGRIPEIKGHMILNKNMSVIGFFWTNYLLTRPELVADFQQKIDDLYLSGEFKPVVSEVRPMDCLPEMLDSIMHHQAYGKIVLTNDS